METRAHVSPPLAGSQASCAPPSGEGVRARQAEVGNCNCRHHPQLLGAGWAAERFVATIFFQPRPLTVATGWKIFSFAFPSTSILMMGATIFTLGRRANGDLPRSKARRESCIFPGTRNPQSRKRSSKKVPKGVRISFDSLIRGLKSPSEIRTPPGDVLVLPASIATEATRGSRRETADRRTASEKGSEVCAGRVRDYSRRAAHLVERG